MIAPDSDRPPKAALFDIGNVIVRWDPRTLYAKLIPEPDVCDRFLAEVCTPAWNLEHDRGRTFDDGVRLLTAEHPHHAEPIAAWRDRWWEMFSGVILETEAVIRDLHALGVPVYGLTNMARETWPGVRAMTPVFEHFADVIVSGEEGLVKPDPAIYRLVLARTGLEAQDLIFVDDSLLNVEAAQALGFHGHHFTDPAALRPALERMGLL